jgi:Predicted membrane protein
MKNYFRFNLEGKAMLPVWIGFMLLVAVPYAVMIYLVNQATANFERPTAFWMAIPIILGTLPVCFFYITKIMIESIEYNGESLRCDMTLGRFYGIYLGGTLLTIITLGIYSPWFITKMQNYIAEKTSYKSREFIFMGEAGNLFGIITLTMILPIIAIILFAYLVFPNHKAVTATESIIQQILTWAIMIPYYYYVYKWSCNFKHNNYHIQWNTQALPAIGKIAKEIGLTLITFGIYMPMAYLKLYDYFIHKTESNVVDNQQIRFGYDMEANEDYPYLLGQTLLTIVTLGIYYPWALANVGKRILNKTYMAKSIVEREAYPAS